MQEFDPSSRGRTDNVVKNIGVAKFMLTHPLRVMGQKKFIAGKSSHNQRVEPLCRHVFFISLYKFHWFFGGFFWFLEDQGFLDISSEFHLHVLR